MQEPELFLVFLRPLNKLKIPYMVTGSMAAMIYGEPRLTHDIDLVIDLKKKRINDFHEAFNSKKFYVPPVEVLNIEAARKMNGHFNLLHQDTGFKADVYLKGKDELHTWAFEHGTTEIISNETIWVAPPEYVILRKLMYYKEGKSEKHLNDIRSMMDHQKGKININQIEQRVKKYNLAKSWEQLSKF